MKKVALMLIVASAATGLRLSAQEVPKGPPEGPGAAKPAARPKAVVPASPAKGGDEEAIRNLLDAFTSAFNAGDAKAAAATYSEKAIVIDEQGGRVEGRDAIAAQYVDAFADNPGGTIAIRVDSLRLLGPEAAIEQGRTTITPAKGAGAPRSPASRQSTSSSTATGSSPSSATRRRATSPPTTASRTSSGSWATGSTRARMPSSPPPAIGHWGATSSSGNSP